MSSQRPEPARGAGSRHAFAAGKLVWLALVPAMAVHCVSCRDGADVVAGDGKAGIRREFQRGPVTVVLTADREELTIAERLNLTIEVIADEGYEVQLPRFGEKLEQFGIVDYRTSRPELIENDRTRLSRSYVLEPFLSGDYRIPAMKVTFRKEGDEEAGQHKIETEEVSIKVTSLLPENVADLQINEIIPPVDLPRESSPVVWIACGAFCLVLAAGVAAGVWYRLSMGSLERGF